MTPLSRATTLRCLTALLVFLAVVLAAAPAAMATAARALVDPDLPSESSALRAEHLTEIDSQLRARYVRFGVLWASAEPERGVYDEAYLAGVEETVGLAAAAGLKVVITFAYTPAWASDTTFWDSPPAGYAAGVYQPFYMPRSDAADDFGAYVAMLAARLKGKVFAYECWNEPNLWVSMYPQQETKGDDLAVRRYARLLRACHDAVHGAGDVGGADPDALIIGGATSPIGEGDESTYSPYRTRPTYWAQAMKTLDLGTYFDAYSHHPYAPGGTANVTPEAWPANPKTTVQLANLGHLLQVFPGKDFYLTEFGYNTSFSQMFGGRALTQPQQADYLRRAYRVAGRYSQVKALFWYLRRDHEWKTGSKTEGVYTGLRTVANNRKRSWFVFAGGTKLTLSAQSPIPKDDYSKLAGVLSSSRLATATNSGGLSGKTLDVQRRVDGRWKTVKSVTTRSGGRYTTWLRLTRDTRVRVLWRGVLASPSRFVDVR